MCFSYFSSHLLDLIKAMSFLAEQIVVAEYFKYVLGLFLESQDACKC